MPAIPEMLTVLEILKRTTDFLAGKGIAGARLNAELLVGHALQCQRMQLYLEFERPLTEAELSRIRPLVRRRAQHEPLQYVIGEVDFAGLRLKVDRRALIPRPETEYLVELVVAWCREHPPVERILDLGTGTGALALALARALPASTFVATDRSEDALALARENANATALAGRGVFVFSDWLSGVPEEEYDVIVANPPYLSARELAEAAPEVRDFEPHSALIASEDGRGDLERIIAAAPGRLRKAGLLALETGTDQHARLLERLRSAGWASAESRKDLAGRDRFILAVW